MNQIQLLADKFEYKRVLDHSADVGKMVVLRSRQRVSDRFVEINKTIGHRLSSGGKRAMHNADMLERA